MHGIFGERERPNRYALLYNCKRQRASRLSFSSPISDMDLGSFTHWRRAPYVYNVWISVLTSFGYFIGSRATGSTVQPFRKPGAVGKGAV